MTGPAPDEARIAPLGDTRVPPRTRRTDRGATTLNASALLALVGIALPTISAAQSPEPMVTDRPDQTESAQVVPAGTVQIEMGAVFTDADVGSEDTESISLLPALARIGILPALEARVGFAGWTRTSTTTAGASSSESGIGSIELGFKVRVTEGNGLSPTVAVLGSALLPTGTAGIRTERVDPAARVALSHELSERIGLSYNLGVRLFSPATDNGDITTETEGIYTLAVGVGLTETIGFFVEGFGAVPVSDGAVSAHLLDGGITFAPLHNMQFDVSGGFGYAGQAEDWFVGLGLSFRVPR
jgi:hypothetical protein